MDAFWDRLNSAQIIGVIAIVVGGIVAVTMILAIVRYQLQALADATALRRERMEAEAMLRTKIIEHASSTGASLDEFVAKGLALPHPVEPEEAENPDAKLNAEIAIRFGMLEAPVDEIEQLLSRVLAIKSAQKRALAEVLEELVDSGADHKPILATIRALCNSYTVSTKECLAPAAAS